MSELVETKTAAVDTEIVMTKPKEDVPVTQRQQQLKKKAN
jgi:hypothetical protein